MKKMKWMASAIISLMLLTVMLTGCGRASEKQVKIIRISISHSYGTATSNIIKEYGLLEQCLPEGYEVEWVQMTSASDMRDALVSGDLDIVCTSLPTFIMGYENGLPIELISFAGGVPIGLYGNQEDIRSLRDFEELDRIAAKSKGNNGHIAFLIACKDELNDAMALDDQISTIQEAEALALLQSSNDYQASIFSFPMNVKAEQAGLYEIENFNDIIIDYGIGSTYFTRTDFYEEEKEVVEALREAQQMALELIESDPKGVAERLSPIFDLESTYIENAFEIMPPRTGYTGYDKLASLLYEIGLIENEPTLFSELPNYEEIK